MTVVINIARNITRSVVRTLESVRGGLVRLLFNGTNQYLNIPAVTLSGVNWSHSIKYTPTAGDIGSAVTLLAGLLTKNASDQLVVTYTDVDSVVQTATSTATVEADMEYTVTVSSSGLGVSLTVTLIG